MKKIELIDTELGIDAYRERFHDSCADLPEGIALRLTEGCRLPTREPVSHKYSYGRALIIGGATGFSGAPVLAANACERSGAGLTHLMVPESIYTVAATKCDGAVVTPLKATASGTVSAETEDEILTVLEHASACAIGPGLGHDRDTRRIVRSVIRSAACPLVLDADALTICGRNMTFLRDCGVPVILTPHEGEFGRLGGDLSEGRLKGALKFTAEYPNVILVLKGYGTLVCAGHEVSVNATGGPAMAKGGSGDVLCGMICSLMAQGFDPAESARCGVYLHGLAGDLAEAEYGEYSLAPSDLIRKIPAAFQSAAGVPTYIAPTV